ncbi:Methyl-accepting chemotaxis protein McpQ [Andreprevotia sp. IGB-42]|uniref:methyl-accepting chemotaxis protein n=1 Tax=Andreprevotia sp. IGB-42 TaxID=2497473 RepID=UPI00135B06CA|nr:methyl-accepting chemotaxis protein [Andreprevotia sp. IGB-42]KAF0812996.1 Methyl-accepting chemotaxis protein McpQ [Andreprevotia sp. IGB-42]
MQQAAAEYYLKPYETYNDGLKAAFSSKERQFFVYTDSYGSFRSVYQPFTSASGETIVAVADAKLDDVHARLNGLLLHALLLATILIAVAVAASFWLSNLVVRPLDALLMAVQKLGSGEADLTVRLPANDTDETGRIAGAFNQFVAELHRLIKVVQTQTRQLGNGVDAIGNVTTQLSSEARAQTGMAASSAATIQQVTVGISSIAEHAHQVESTVKQADASAQDSATAMRELDSANRQMAGTMQELGTAMGSLAEESRQITQILASIKAIAGQTNLLALNAAIEAARAGEQGRGFAVVADEVRKLAERTTQSTVEIETLLHKISSETDNAVTRMDTASHTVEHNRALVGGIAERFGAMQADMRSAASQVSEISGATREQSAAAEQIAQVAEQINRQAEQTEAALERTRGTLHELATSGQALQDVVNRFRL